VRIEIEEGRNNYGYALGTKGAVIVLAADAAAAATATAG